MTSLSMTQPSQSMAPGRQESGRIRLTTLIIVRWIAVGGQILALLLVGVILGYKFPLWPCLATVAAAAVVNLAVSPRGAAGVRLSGRAAAIHLAFDTGQLAVLLFLTGGLDNPFSLLFLVPVTISATVLSLRSTIALGLLAIFCATVLAGVHLPLPWSDPGLTLPWAYVTGHWIALVFGITFIALYAWRVSAEAQQLSDALVAAQMALAREQRLSELGGLAAATAHQLGTPLGTIAVVAGELRKEVPPDGPLAEDVALIASQAERCRELLAQIAKRPDDADLAPFGSAKLTGLVESVAAQHGRPDIELAITVTGGADDEPNLPNQPEIRHGLGNLIENAFDFADAAVAIELDWSGDTVVVTIRDDGPGFTADVLDSIGEPYVSGRLDDSGMGLGVFIAKTLLERTGAELRFDNRRQSGAVVAIIWPRAIIG